MPSKTVTEYEREIADALLRVNLITAGLWTKMRILSEKDSGGRPGELWHNAAPVAAEQLPALVGCSAAKVPALLDKLSAIGLIKVSNGIISSPPLARIHEVRIQTAKRVDRHRALNNAKRALHSPDVTPSPPPDGSFSPKPSSSLSPSSSSSREGENGDESKDRQLRAARLTPGDDEIDSEIRAYIGCHPMLTYDPKTHGKCRRLVEAVGWSRAKELIEQGISRSIAFPIGWALGKAQNLAQGAAAADGNGHANGSRRSARTSVALGRMK
jgi:hypothetical protein